MCQLTSLAMVMNSLGIKRLNAGGQYEDELYSYAKLAGYGGNKLWKETFVVYGKVLENYEYTYDSIESKNESQIKSVKEFIDKGIPVILSMDYMEDWEHGHVIVIVGYTEKGFIVNDPYGNRNSGVKYPAHDDKKGDGAFEEYEYGKWLIGKKWAVTLSKL